MKTDAVLFDNRGNILCIVYTEQKAGLCRYYSVTTTNDIAPLTRIGRLSRSKKNLKRAQYIQELERVWRMSTSYYLCKNVNDCTAE